MEAVIPNPLRVEDWPLREHKDGYLLWVGRMAPYKGAQLAVAAARRAGRPLVLAGPIQRGQEEFFTHEIEPNLDAGRITYIGEIGGRRKTELFAGASALLMPITWHEPFGMVMVEAQACGTPVIAFPEGGAAEIVLPGDNGFLVANADEMADAVARLGEIDPHACRQSVQSRYAPAVVAAAYEAVYRRAGQTQRVSPAMASAAVEDHESPVAHR
jgi:glycosyltransferase involved in cell wall biosynthesis